MDKKHRFWLVFFILFVSINIIHVGEPIVYLGIIGAVISGIMFMDLKEKKKRGKK